MSDDDDDDEGMETGEVNRQARPGARGSFGEAAPITADQLASAIANAQSVLGMAPPPPSPGNFLVLLTQQYEFLIFITLQSIFPSN